MYWSADITAGPKDLFEESDQPCVEKEAHTEFTLSIGEKHHFPADLAMSDEVDRNHEGSSQKHRSDEGHDEVRQEVMPTQRKRRSVMPSYVELDRMGIQASIHAF